jgi:hypothetical protein
MTTKLKSRLFVFLSYFKAIGWILIAFWGILPASPKKCYWWEDGRGPSVRTPAWQPQRTYGPDIEQALTILSTIDNGEVAYLRSRGNPIVFIPGRKGTMGSTTAEGVIELPNLFQGKPPEIAVVLSHEIFHAERHDPFQTPPEYSPWRRIFWQGEEESAHSKSLRVAAQLWPWYPSVWHVLDGQWFLEVLLYLFGGLQAIFAAGVLIYLSVSAYRRLTTWPV